MPAPSKRPKPTEPPPASEGAPVSDDLEIPVEGERGLVELAVAESTLSAEAASFQPSLEGSELGMPTIEEEPVESSSEA